MFVLWDVCWLVVLGFALVVGLSGGKRNTAGRPASSVWQWFEKEGSGSGRRHHATCQLCGEKAIDGRLETLRKHLLHSCGEASDEIREQVEDMLCSDHGDGGQVQGKPPKKGKGDNKQSTMTQHFQNSKVEERKRKEIDSKILRFFATSNLAWIQASSVFFIDLICTLRPGYSPPSMYGFVAIHCVTWFVVACPLLPSPTVVCQSCPAQADVVACWCRSFKAS